MSLVERRDTMNHRSVSRHPTQSVPGPARSSEGAGRAPDATRAKSLSFGEDFNSEHSFSYVAASVTAVSINSNPAEPARRRTHSANDRGVPSCVYLG